MTRLVKMLVRHEGLRLKPYLDSVGKLTIGVGRNLDDVGISEDEALHMLRNDLATAQAAVSKALPFLWTLSEARSDALIDMALNLGEPRFRGFKKMIAAIERRDFEAAAREMLDSKWARQVGARSQELAEMVRTGSYK